MNGRKQCEPFELNGGILHAYGRCKQHIDERKTVLQSMKGITFWIF